MPRSRPSVVALLKLILYTLLVVTWSGLALHYYHVLKVMAGEGWWTTHPLQYIAVECWLLLCCVMVTVLALHALHKDKSEGVR